MSLKEAYTLAHTAQCRLQIAATRPDRNLRFVVGHLMHYESLRLRIVEIEHDISKSQRARAVQFKGTGQVDHTLQHKPSTGQLGRKSPPPPAPTYDDSDSDDFPDDMTEDNEADEGLSLSRFPSGSARPQAPKPDLTPVDSHQQPPAPDLESDNSDDDDDYDEPTSPEEPSQEELEQCVQGEGSEVMATMYEGVRKCACHGKTDAPSFERMWELPPDQANAKKGVTRAIAQVSAETLPQMSCTEPVVA